MHVSQLELHGVQTPLIGKSLLLLEHSPTQEPYSKKRLSTHLVHKFVLLLQFKQFPSHNWQFFCLASYTVTSEGHSDTQVLSKREITYP